MTILGPWQVHTEQIRLVVLTEWYSLYIRRERNKIVKNADVNHNETLIIMLSTQSKLIGVVKQYHLGLRHTQWLPNDIYLVDYRSDLRNKLICMDSKARKPAFIIWQILVVLYAWCYDAWVVRKGRKPNCFFQKMLFAHHPFSPKSVKHSLKGKGETFFDFEENVFLKNYRFWNQISHAFCCKNFQIVHMFHKFCVIVSLILK